MPSLEQSPENGAGKAQAAPSSASFDLSAPLRADTLSRTLRAVADILDGRGLDDPGLPSAAPTCACGSLSAAELAVVARSYLRHRRERERLLPDLFADPAWDILLDLFAASLERRPVSVSSACVAAAVPPTTALRWIGTLEARGLVLRVADPADRRSTHLRLAGNAEVVVTRWLERLAHLCDPDMRVPQPLAPRRTTTALRIPPPR